MFQFGQGREAIFGPFGFVTANGSHNSGWPPGIPATKTCSSLGNRNSGGNTPAVTKGSSFNVMARPMIETSSSEATTPQAVAQDCHAMTAEDFFVYAERTPQHWARDSQHRKQVGRHARGFQLLGFACSRQNDRSDRHERHMFEGCRRSRHSSNSGIHRDTPT